MAISWLLRNYYASLADPDADLMDFYVDEVEVFKK